MAKETDLELFIGVDHQYKFPVLNEAEDTAIDVSGWSLSWMVKKKKTFDDADAVITKTTTGGGVSITGTWNATPGSSTQRVVVTIADTDTDAIPAGTYFHELKRTGAGVEAVLSYGEIEILRSVHHA